MLGILKGKENFLQDFCNMGNWRLNSSRPGQDNLQSGTHLREKKIWDGPWGGKRMKAGGTINGIKKRIKRGYHRKNEES